MRKLKKNKNEIKKKLYFKEYILILSKNKILNNNILTFIKVIYKIYH
jgi:hypothetical protein